MLLEGLELTTETVLPKDLVASELGTKYRELAEVGNGSYGQAYQPGLKGGGAANPRRVGRPEARFVEELRRRGGFTSSA